ncbi:vanadium-dependent haloperoxidase [Massilia sp. CF038]|uniref:vanadium-dependent haloperoxidase n=1 Tax=Massilia sp. CF038 TaxID=1881045 RepID=UPI0009198DB4|nr:vanadium-dependent haloperoxidase [Massilia sp. CF038]SHG67444.1 PAP2 superfamily protein [Massilia sp. CF038]
MTLARYLRAGTRMLVVLAVWAAHSASAAPILSYAAEPTPAAAYDPAVFGTSDAAEAQAALMARSWPAQPASMAWTALTLKMIVKHKIAPTRAARGSALVHVAMHDAWALADADVLARQIAVSTAAAHVLAFWMPSEEHGFDRIVGALARRAAATGQADPATLARALQVGAHVAQRVIARAQADGAERGWNGLRLEWYGDGRYYGPGAWEPTAPYFYYPPDEPFAPAWQTWVLRTPGQFRPTPPAFGSARFLADLHEVVALQKNLTAEQLTIAKFWVDGSGSVTPPGHWNQIALDLAQEHHLGEEDTVRLFAMLNMALADTFIAVWDVKYHYWTARPITTAKTVLGINLKTAILTPPFPSYVSGHAAFSGASARILASFFPEQAARLDALAAQAATSRLYGGIHYRHDNEDGLLLGRAIGEVVLRTMRKAP